MEKTRRESDLQSNLKLLFRAPLSNRRPKAMGAQFGIDNQVLAGPKLAGSALAGQRLPVSQAVSTARWIRQ